MKLTQSGPYIEMLKKLAFQRDHFWFLKPQNLKNGSGIDEHVRCWFLTCNGLFQEKFWHGQVKDMEFPGVLKKEHAEIPGINLKRKVISRGVQEKLWISIGFGFWSWNFQRVSHNFAEFPGVKACFL